MLLARLAVACSHSFRRVLQAAAQAPLRSPRVTVRRMKAFFDFRLSVGHPRRKTKKVAKHRQDTKWDPYMTSPSSQQWSSAQALESIGGSNCHS